MKLTSQFGIYKTTIQDIANEVGISVGAIYTVFKNKEELIKAYGNFLCQKHLANFRKLAEQQLPAEQLLHDFVIGVFFYFGKLVLEDRGFCQIFYSIETAGINKNFSKQREFLREQIYVLNAAILKRGVDEGIFETDDIHRAARLFINAFEIYREEIFILKELDKILPSIEEMYNFLICAIQKTHRNIC